jgi:hypothetical protein
MEYNKLDKLIFFLDSILGNHKEYSSKKEFYYECKFCNRNDGVKKLAIKLDINAVNKRGDSSFTSYHCWRDTSHVGGNLITLVKKMKLPSDKIAEARSLLHELKFDIKNFESMESKLERQLFNPIVEEINIELPTEFKSFITSNRNDIEYKNAFKYISSRKITVGDIIKNNIGYCDSGKYSGYIIIPSYNKDGKLNYFVGRNYYDNDKYKHKNYDGSHDLIFNELHIEWSKPLILCEGAFDYLAIKRNAIPLIGKYIPNALYKAIISNNVKTIYIALDSDAIRDSLRYIENFVKSGIRVFLVKMDKKDPSAMGFSKFWDNLSNSIEIGFLEILQLKMEKV